MKTLEQQNLRRRQLDIAIGIGIGAGIAQGVYLKSIEKLNMSQAKPCNLSEMNLNGQNGRLYVDQTVN